MAGAPVGNTNAKKENRLITDELRRVCTQSPEKLKEACIKVLDEAVQGNLGAFTVLADRLEGKPAQAVTVGNEEGETFKTETTLRPQETIEQYLIRMGISEE